MSPLVGLNVATDPAFAHAVAPLFTAGLVDAIEWDIDSPWVIGREPRVTPPWMERLLDYYAAEGNLYGHCTWLSFLTAKTQIRQLAWLDRIAEQCAKRPYRLVSEHLGFMGAGVYAVGTLLPVPYVSASVAVGRRSLAGFFAAVGAPVGLENLAGSLNPTDATTQGELLSDILRPSNGFVLLDLHNIFTQSANLRLNAEGLLDTFPKDLVREIHVSGGYWDYIDGRPFRFDSHNDAVPREVFSLLAAALKRFPNVQAVFLERRGNTLASQTDVEQLHADYRQMVHVVRSSEPHGRLASSNASKPKASITAGVSADDLGLYQEALVTALMLKSPSETIKATLLANPELKQFHEYVRGFLPHCVTATSKLVRRWAKTEAQLSAEGLIPNLLS